MLLYIIRHGEPDYVKDCLTERGWKEAKALARKMVKINPDKIYASPMGRAKETAMPTCELLGKDYEVLDWAHEIEDDRLTTFPDGKLKSVSVLPNFYYRTEKNLDLPYDKAFESDGFSTTNMKSACKTIVEGGRALLERHGYKEEGGVYKIINPTDEKIAVFCHSCMGRAWISHMLHIPINIMWSSFTYSFTGVTVINFQNHTEGYTAPQCLSYCDLGHLYEDGQNIFYDNKIHL